MYTYEKRLIVSIYIIHMHMNYTYINIILTINKRVVNVEFFLFYSFTPLYLLLNFYSQSTYLQSIFF